MLCGMHTAIAQRNSTQAWQRWFIAGLCLLFLGLSVQYCIKAMGTGERSNRSAFLRWRDQLQHLDSEDIYQLYNFPYPPIMAMLLEPLMRLPPLAGSLCWFFMKLAMTLLALAWIFRLVESPERPFPPWAKAVTVLLSLRPITGDLSHGNVNLYILLLVAGGLFAFHQRKDCLAGALLALGVSCKVTPALFVPYFLWKRAWKTLAGCAIGLLLFFILIPGWRLGFHRNITLLQHWTGNMVAPFLVQGSVTSDHLNQSLPGLVYRLATHSPSGHDPLGSNPEYHNFLDLEPRLAGWLVKACMLGFAALVMWSCRTPLQSRKGWRLAAEFSLIVVGMLLFSERTWKHHCVTLMLPFAVLTYYLATCRPGPILRAYLTASLVAVTGMMLLTGTPGLRGLDEVAKKAEIYGAYVWAYLVLAAALVTLLRTAERLEDAEPGTPHVPEQTAVKATASRARPVAAAACRQ
jgi:hypothetical protein